jgi:hypothetical protein
MAVTASSLWAGEGSAARQRTGLVRGPMVFRLTDYARAPTTTNIGSYRYAVFKLNRNPQTRIDPRHPPDFEDQQEGAEVIPPGTTTYGNFYLEGYELDDVGSLFGRRRPAGTKHCYVGYIDNGSARVLQRLRRTPVGRRMRVTVHPRDPRRTDGTAPFGRLHTRYPKLRVADVGLASKSARRQLWQIRC